MRKRLYQAREVGSNFVLAALLTGIVFVIVLVGEDGGFGKPLYP
mgnify:FL=1